MKNLLLTLSAGFSISAYAGGQYSINYNTWDIEGTSVDGPGLALSGAGENMLYDVDFFRLSAGGASITFNTISLGYAFGDMSEGSFYGGLFSADANVGGASRESDLELGWVKRGAAGNQMKVGIITDDGNTIVAEVQTDNGFDIGLLSNDGDTLFRVGYGWKF